MASPSLAFLVRRLKQMPVFHLAHIGRDGLREGHLPLVGRAVVGIWFALGWCALAGAPVYGCGTCRECRAPLPAMPVGGPAEGSLSPVAPLAGEPTQFRFGVVGDTQGLGYVEQLITDMNRHDPAAVIFPGDLVGTGSASSWGEWNRLTSHFVGGENRRLMVPGNHDLPVGGDALWQQTFSWLPSSPTIGGQRGIDQMDYFYDIGNTRFISITTDSQQHGAGGPPAALPWLEQVLQDPGTQAKDHVFVFSHHPITFNNYDRTGGTEGAWWQTMAAAENVRGVFVGHWHQYQPSQPDPHHGAWEVIAGTGNRGFSGHPWQNEVGFSLVEVNGPRAVLKFYGDADDDGSYDDLLDQFTMADVRPGPAGVVAHYDFEDRGANRDSALSDLGKVNHGAYYGNAATVPGVTGQALRVDGQGDYADGRGIGDYVLAILGDLTVSLDARFEQLQSGSGQNTLVSYTADVAGYTDREEAVNQPYNFRIRDDRHLEVFWERGNNQKETFVSTVPAPITAGDWHEYRFTRDATAGTVQFYIDGQPLGTSLAFDPNTQLPTGGAQGILRMGINYDRDHSPRLTGAFDGWIDNVSVWNQVTLDSYEGPAPGDLNRDGRLDETDIDWFIQGWMEVTAEDTLSVRWSKGDLDLDGASTLYDLVSFQRTLAQAGIPFPGLPEPHGIQGLLLGVLLMSGHLRRERRVSA